MLRIGLGHRPFAHRDPAVEDLAGTDIGDPEAIEPLCQAGPVAAGCIERSPRPVDQKLANEVSRASGDLVDNDQTWRKLDLERCHPHLFDDHHLEPGRAQAALVPHLDDIDHPRGLAGNVSPVEFIDRPARGSLDELESVGPGSSLTLEGHETEGDRRRRISH